MKTLILTGFIFFNVITAFASENRIIAQLSNVDLHIDKISIQENGILTISDRQNSSPVLKKLHPTTFHQISELSQRLSEAIIETRAHKIMCMIVLDPRTVFNLSVSSNSSNPNAELKTVLTYSSCATPSVSEPKDQYAYADATALKETLEALAREAVFNRDTL